MVLLLFGLIQHLVGNHKTSLMISIEKNFVWWSDYLNFVIAIFKRCSFQQNFPFVTGTSFADLLVLIWKFHMKLKEITINKNAKKKRSRNFFWGGGDFRSPKLFWIFFLYSFCFEKHFDSLYYLILYFL